LREINDAQDEVMLAAVAALAGLAGAAPIEGEFLLQTKNTTMAFRKSGDTWLMVHYGAKIEEAGDANDLPVL
jgi:hypothetical protein